MEEQEKPLLDEETINSLAVEETPTQRLDKDGQPLEPPPGHGGRPQVE